MIEMLVCGLMAWYHVDCVQFTYYDLNPTVLRDDQGDWFGGMSTIENKIGIMVLLNNGHHDTCGNSVMGHEYQRFHQQRWDFYFCNHITSQG